MNNNIKIILVLALLVPVTFAAGCIGQAPPTTIESEDEVGERVTDISSDVEDIGSILDDIDTSLGG